jgi:hypothetical protein
MEHRMPFERFEALLDIHGAQPERWPADQRLAAQALIAASAQARTALDSAHALDALLDLASPVPAPSADLAAKILAARPSLGGSVFVAPEPPDILPGEAVSAPLTWATPRPIISRTLRHRGRSLLQMGHSRLIPTALAASLLLGVVSGALIQNILPTQTQTMAQTAPTVQDLFILGLGTQLAALPTELEEATQ